MVGGGAIQKTQGLLRVLTKMWARRSYFRLTPAAFGGHVDFLDEEPAAATTTAAQSPTRERRGRSARSPRQQIMIRRGIALGGGLLILILLVLGVRGCLNARKERALKDYARDVAAIVDETTQVSESFFGRLDDPGPLSVTEFVAQVNTDRSSMESLLQRVEALDTPGDMSQAQNALELTYRLRADALAAVSERISTALAAEGRDEALTQIAEQMRVLFSADTVYKVVAKPAIDDVLAKEGVDDTAIPDSQFVPDGIKWLDEDNLGAALGQVSGATAAATPGIHGLGLIETSIGGTVLQEGVPATVSAEGTPELDVQVQNQGESEETGVSVSVTIDGGTEIDGEIASIGPGETESVTIPLTPAPAGDATIDVDVQAVPGEQVEDNNRASYTVSFQ
jgi:CARDB protein